MQRRNTVNIFQLTENDNFFSILSSPNKSLYWDIICEFYDTITSTPERRINRSSAKRIVDEVLFQNKTVNTDSSDFIKRLIDCGWILNQYDGIQNCDYISFTQYTLSFIHYNYNYVQNSSSIKTSEILNTIMHIINDLSYQTDKKSEIYLYPYKQGLLRVKNLTSDLIDELYGIISKINTSINNILKTDDLQTLVDRLSEYLKEIDNGYIANMYKNSNITISQKNLLIDLLFNIKSDPDFQQRIIQDIRNTRIYQSYDNNVSDEELFDELSNLLETIQFLFCTKYQDCRRKIESLKVDILSHAITKLQILSSDKSSNVAKINHIIGLLEKNKETDSSVEEIINQLFSIKKSVRIFPNSIYDRNSLSVIEKPQPISDIEITDEEFNNSFHNVPDNSKEANKFALQLLGDKNELQIKDVSPEHLDKIITIASYSDYPNREYTIEITDEEIIIGNILTKNFIIRRN